MEMARGVSESLLQSEPAQSDEIQCDDPVRSVPTPEAEPVSVCTPSGNTDPPPKKYYKKVLYYAGGSKLSKPTAKKDETDMRCDDEDDSESECTSSDSEYEQKPVGRRSKRVAFKRGKRSLRRTTRKRAKPIAEPASDSISESESDAEDKIPIKRPIQNLKRNVSHYQFF
jgi:hypothetical protein